MHIWTYKVTPEIVRYVKEKWPEVKEVGYKWAVLRDWVEKRFGVRLSRTTLRKIIDGEYDGLLIRSKNV